MASPCSARGPRRWCSAAPTSSRRRRRCSRPSPAAHSATWSNPTMLLLPISLSAAQKTLAMAGTVAHLPHPTSGGASEAGICVIGEGYAGAAPDVALLDLAVSGRGASAAEALARLRERTAAVLAALAG